MTFSNNCIPGQYYDKKKLKYLIFYIIFFINNTIKSLICVTCPALQYKDAHNESCNPCPNGAYCENGLQYNQLGDIIYII